MAAGAARRRPRRRAGPQHRAQAFPEHQPADGGQQDDVGQRDHEIELAERAQQREGPDAERGADDAAAQQHQRQRRIDRAPPPIGDRAGKRRGRDVARDGRDRDRRRDADEDQQRRHQEAAADAEHAGDESDRRAHRQDEEDIDRKVGDRKVELHARLLLQLAAKPAEAAHGVDFLIEAYRGGIRNLRAESGRVRIDAAPLNSRNRRGEGLKNPLSRLFCRRPQRALKRGEQFRSMHGGGALGEAGLAAAFAELALRRRPGPSRRPGWRR